MMASPSNPLENASSSEPTAADVMTPLSRTCSPFSTVTEAVMVFKDENTGMIPIVDAGKPVGVITDRDIALAVANTPDLGQQPVTRIMAKDVPVLAAHAEFGQVVQALVETGSRWALIVDAEGSLIGSVDRVELAELVARAPDEPTSAAPHNPAPPEVLQP